MTASVYGIKETKEALEFGLTLYKTTKVALADGKIGISDLPLLIGLVGPGKAAIEGVALIAKEAADLQPEEVDELLSIARPVLEELVPDALEETMWRIISAARMIAEAFGLLK